MSERGGGPAKPPGLPVMWQNSEGPDGAAVRLLGRKPGRRIIVIADELIIICDRWLISTTLEVAADRRSRGH